MKKGIELYNLKRQTACYVNCISIHFFKAPYWQTKSFKMRPFPATAALPHTQSFRILVTQNDSSSTSCFLCLHIEKKKNLRSGL